ncbi:MAG: bifunctional pyr operon transcriptional regulator/uracil phosphoribosyltransferase, partial [Acidobacteriota bacterium]
MKKDEASPLAVKRQVLDPEAMRRIIRRMAVEILERQPNLDDVILVGIRTRGLPLAERLADEIEAIERRRPPIGAL